MATASGRTQPPPPEGLTENGHSQGRDQRKSSSFGFLRRSKSTEPIGERKLSGSRKKMSKAMEEEFRRQREAMPKHPPRLPDLSPTPILETFGGDENRDGLGALASEPTSSQQHQAPRSSLSTPVDYDPYARTESMTHRGRFSYASSAVSTVNNPRRLRRRKDPTPYNVLVIGARNSGKTAFLNFLRNSLAMPAHKHPSRSLDEYEYYDREAPANEGYTYHYLETEIDGERVGLTLWDSQGLERNVVDIQLRGITGFLESKFEETLSEEMKVIRSPGVRDTHIHCTFLILDPVNLDQNIAAAERAAEGRPHATDSPIVGVLDQNLDLQVLRTVVGKTTVVPVISKADTITTAHMAYLKKAVWESLKKANIDPLEILTLDESDEYESSVYEDEAEAEESTKEEPKDEEQPETEHNPDAEEKPTEDAPSTSEPRASKDESSPQPEPVKAPQSPSQQSRKSNGSATAAAAPSQHMPFSILSPDPHSLAAGDEPVGRKFPWGFADPYNAEHCDFVKLKDSVFTDWRSELREASRLIWYENWRTSRLNRNDPAAPVPAAQQKKSFGGRMGPAEYGRRVR